MVMSSRRTAITRWDAEGMIRDAWDGSMSVPVADLVTLRLLARALGQRTYREDYAGVGPAACSREGFARRANGPSFDDWRAALGAQPLPLCAAAIRRRLYISGRCERH